MKALTLWQPWASAIAAGLKTYETRSWSTVHRGLLAIHASQRKYPPMWPVGCIGVADLALPLPLGAVVCIVRLIDVCPTKNLTTDALFPFSEQERSWGDYTPGRFAWKLELVEVFTEPIPAKGKQGLWEWEKP